MSNAGVRYAVACFLAAVGFAAHAQAQVPVRITQSGYLLDASDQPLNASSVAMVFRLFAVDTAGAALWTGSCTPAVAGGYYVVTLGDDCGTSLTSSQLPAGADRWVEIELAGITLAPRQRLGAVSSAADAQQLAGLGLADLDQRWARLDATVASAAQPGSLKVSGFVSATSFTGSAEGLTGLPAGQLTGAVADSLLSTNIARVDAASTTFAGSVGATSFAGSGAGLTGLPAGQLTGAVADSLLSSNIARVDAASTTFAGSVGATSFAGSAAGLTGLPAAQLTGSVPFAALPVGTTSTTVARGDHTHASYGNLGDNPTAPATSCSALLLARVGIQSGVYWVQPAQASSPFQAYCDMSNDTGGWTLVWSNLRGFTQRPTTRMSWMTATNTQPLFNGAKPSTNLESWEVYTGLRYWSGLAPNAQFRYDWATNAGQAVTFRQRCSYTLAGATYTLNLSTCARLLGTVDAGLVTFHNGRAFSTLDYDNSASACGGQYSSTPFWYFNCWSGSINGGGELSGGAYFNGAYWTGSAQAWGDATGNGAGNGWLYVR